MAEGQGLSITDLQAFHGDFQALQGVSLALPPGTTLALVGANGAGKSSLLGAISGLVRSRGAIRLGDRRLDDLPPSGRARAGVALCPEGRRLFPSLSVRENLLIGAAVRRKGPWTQQRVEALFPVLRDFARRPAGLLSGGQQQMLAIGRSLMSNPDLLLLDEISLGLSPLVAEELRAAIRTLAQESGLICILVDQDIRAALEASDRFLCLFKGKVASEGSARGVDPVAIERAFFGETA